VRSSGDEDFYLRANPATKANHERKSRGYDNRFGPILADLATKSCPGVG
jgi:hypothetical protein